MYTAAQPEDRTVSQPELFRRFPSLSIPYRALATIPTPVDHFEALGSRMGIDLWVKRDDQSGALYGGNKLRKLEFLLADALDQGLEHVWTVGAIGSHHALATALWARKLGLEPSVLHFPQPLTPHVQKNIKAIATTRANLTLADHRNDLPAEVFKVKLREWLSSGRDFYYIPGGGSSPLGTVGYVNAALELAAQCEAEAIPVPDVIYVAAGTCGTLVGLTLGLKIAGLATKVIGVRVVDKVICNKPLCAYLGHQVSDLLYEAGMRNVPRLSNKDYHLTGDYFGGAYGVPTAPGEAAIANAKTYGLNLEGTYTGKAFSALEAQASDWQSKTVMYWHTLSGADLTDVLEQFTPEMLPPEYRKFLEPV